MDTTLILIVVLSLLVLTILAIFLIFKLRKKNFVAPDGSSFNSQIDLDLYQELLLKTEPLFSLNDDNSNSQKLLGFDKIFLTKLKSDGFRDLKTLLKYANQFKALSDLINP